jgi:hypothetical protein
MDRIKIRESNSNVTRVTFPQFWSGKPPPGPGSRCSSSPSSCLAPGRMEDSWLHLKSEGDTDHQVGKKFSRLLIVTHFQMMNLLHGKVPAVTSVHLLMTVTSAHSLATVTPVHSLASHICTLTCHNRICTLTRYSCTLQSHLHTHAPQ